PRPPPPPGACPPPRRAPPPPPPPPPGAANGTMLGLASLETGNWAGVVQWSRNRGPRLCRC
ncbi:hypothetical protein, partial [Nocardia abscessus]|uniref:hypothetical protein n=1 Tax=Nocardia abscessus TaxID=120957 RepID=UPI0024577ECC